METKTNDDKKERIRVLLGAYDRIQNLWHELGPELQQLQEVKTIEVDHVLELAERLSYTAHAPIGWKEGFPLINKFPPAPQPDQMRQGKLAEAKYQDYSSQPEVLASSSAGQIISRIAVTNSQLEYLKNSVRLKISEQMNKMDIGDDKESNQKGDEPTQKMARRKVNIKFDVDSDSDS
ncbi:hypothetical protein EON65_10650 [archaeon]|nr:MAG: hypothetical protein EON65_10650 [archaeon]